MGIFSRFEDRVEDTVEGAASRVSKAPISPVQIAKKAEKQMRRETMVGAGKQFAPTLYTVLVNPDDDDRLFGYYPTLAGETETYLSAKAAQEGLVMDGNPLVRFIVDEGLRHGKFEVIAEVVAAPIVAQLREEEMERYGLAPAPTSQPVRGGRGRGYSQQPYDARGYDDYDGYDEHGQQPYDARSQAPRQPVRQKPPLPYVPEDEIDRSIDYGEYTFNSEDFEDYRDKDPEGDAPVAYNEAAQYGQANQQPLGNAGGGQGWDPDSAPIPERQAHPQAGGQVAKPAAQPMQQANTVVFAAGNAAGAAGAATPDRHAVRARLVDRTNNRPYDLAGTRIKLGRESSNDIVIADINASRRHAEVTLNQQGLWVITDMNSMNGTLVNGISVASQPLYPGDIVTIGKTDLEFTLV